MKKTRYITQAAVIAALYVVLSLISGVLGLSAGVFQLRLSEALTVLPYFTVAAVPGLSLGCAAYALISGANVWDVVFGTVATLIAALATRALKNKSPYLACIPPIVANTLIIPPVLSYAYGAPQSMLVCALGVFVGELLACAGLGNIVVRLLVNVGANDKSIHN